MLRRGPACRSRALSLLTALAVVLVSGCGDKPKPAAGPIPVKVADVIQRDVPIYREWIGTTVGYVTAQIRPKVSGYLVSQNYAEGYAGQDRRPALPDRSAPVPERRRSGQGQARAVRRRSSRQARPSSRRRCRRSSRRRRRWSRPRATSPRPSPNQVKTQLEVERYTPLAARGAISQQLLDNTVQNNLANEATVLARSGPTWRRPGPTCERTQAGVDKARADVAAAQAAIVQAKAGARRGAAEPRLDQGLLADQRRRGIKKADIGDLVGASTVLTTVASIDPIYVQFDLTEQQYLRWREAQRTLRDDRALPDRADPVRRPDLPADRDGRDPRPRGRAPRRAPSP